MNTASERDKPNDKRREEKEKRGVFFWFELLIELGLNALFGILRWLFKLFT